MEKLAFYLFISGLITTVLMFLAYVGDAIAARLARPLLAADTGGGDVTEAPRGDRLGRFGTMVGWMGAVILLLALVTRSVASGRGPFANMYDFSIAFGWGILLVYLLIEWRYRTRALGIVVLPIAVGLLLYAASLPSAIQPTVPALQNSTLLTLHVSVAILAYACFAISFGAATLYLLQDRLNTRFLPSLDAMDEAGFFSAALGFPFMTLVLVLGAYWANTAWGRYWGWDPKETASLVTWLLYAGYLHARALRDWRGRRAAVLLLIGFVAVMLTYFGNYFLGGLHSYS